MAFLRTTARFWTLPTSEYDVHERLDAQRQQFLLCVLGVSLFATIDGRKLARPVCFAMHGIHNEG
jgi:hypothetical protein